jgi:hypothetical protein
MAMTEYDQQMYFLKEKKIYVNSVVKLMYVDVVGGVAELLRGTIVSSR